MERLKRSSRGCVYAFLFLSRGATPFALRCKLSLEGIAEPFGTDRICSVDTFPSEEQVALSFENVQQHIGGHDCGLFALAFATSLCYGDIPSSLFYDQKSLRNHYVNCIENNEI
ncbi:unnamed protein product [Rotaria sordida]|uniref:Ubiquitin-like protease family profile domain-containing protein n=1 Tax=Rotaria sordida TaxID=392033 RepID=A0A819M9X4_9BILA|nr:unnamed protein product [Rotaria sordida]